MSKLPPVALRSLSDILGAPLLVSSELKGGQLVTIYPCCNNALLMRFLRNWKISKKEALSLIEVGKPNE